MKFSNTTGNLIGAGGISFHPGATVDIAGMYLTPAQVKGLATAISVGTLLAVDAEAAQLVGIENTANAQFGIPIELGITKAVTADRSLVTADDAKLLVNSTGSNLTFTVPAGLPTDFSCGLVQTSTGTVTIAAGSGVTFIGSDLSSAAAGDTVSLIYVSANTYLVKKA